MQLAVYKCVTQCPYLQYSNIRHIDLGVIKLFVADDKLVSQ